MKVVLLVLGIMALGAVKSDRHQEALAAAKAAKRLISDAGPMRSQLVLPFDADAREEWGYVPGKRKGLNWKEMSPAQRKSAHGLLSAALSEWGLRRIGEIREILEPELRRMENNSGRDPDLYWFAIFGEPSESGPWSWRYEGHHISITFTYDKGKVVSSTPLFLGANPAKYSQGFALRAEEELGRALLKLLNEHQRTIAIVSKDAPADIVTSNARVATIKERRGIRATEMTASQRFRLRELVELYAKVLKPEAMAQRLDRVKQGGWDELRFAWMGGMEAGQPHYYCVSGPKFIIEYDNTQNGANHIHTVWRDFEGDFGRDSLAEHYSKKSHR